MMVPGRMTLLLAGGLVVLLLASVVEPGIAVFAIAFDVAIVVVCISAGRKLAQFPLTVQREAHSRYQIGQVGKFVYVIENRGDRAMVVSIRQRWPTTIKADRMRTQLLVEAGEVVRVALDATPQKRGKTRLPPAEVDIQPSLASWARRRWLIDEGAEITIYPDLQNLFQYDRLRRARALNLLGIHRTRPAGSGRDFDQLREYLPDDDYRNINWSATARRQRPITNVYQAERSQDIILCLDCGRMMGNPVGDGTALDRAIDASILVTHVANSQGDRVGLSLFSDDMKLFLKPAAGTVGVRKIIDELVDVVPEGVFPSYAALFSALRAAHKRRSLVLLFTDLNDPQLAEDLTRYLRLVSGRHLIVVVSLRDAMLDRAATGGADGRRATHRVLAARRLSNERDKHIRGLIQAGVQVLDTDTDSFTMATVNRYLQIKMRQLL